MVTKVEISRVENYGTERVNVISVRLAILNVTNPVVAAVKSIFLYPSCFSLLLVTWQRLRNYHNHHASRCKLPSKQRLYSAMVKQLAMHVPLDRKVNLAEADTFPAKSDQGILFTSSALFASVVAG